MRRSLFMLSTILFAAAAHAQEVPIRAAGADGRFQTAYDRKPAVAGFTAAQLATFRATVDHFAAVTVAKPQVNSPSAPLCMRASTWFTVNPDTVLSGNFSLLRPLILGGRCVKMTGGGIEVDFNMPTFQRTRLTSEESGGSEWFQIEADEVGPGGFTMESNGDLYEVIALNNRPLLQPVSIERYLRARIGASTPAAEMSTDAAFTQADYERWKAVEFPRFAAEARRDVRNLAAQTSDSKQKQMFIDAGEASITAQDEAQRNRIALTAQYRAARAGKDAVNARQADRYSEALAALSPVQRSLPACATEDGSFDARPDCPTHRTLFEMNAGYFDPQRPSTIQLVVLSTPSHAYHGEDALMQSERMAMWIGLDRNLLHGS